MPESRSRRALFIAASCLLLPTLVFALAEGAARFNDAPVGLFDHTDRWRADRDFLVDHPSRGFALAPGFRNGLYEINEQGFRGPPLPPDLGRRRVLVALGESTTFGWEVPEAETYPALLERELQESAGGPVTVINAGVPSYNSTQVRLYLDELLDRFEPDLVLISVMWNDVFLSMVRHWYPEINTRGRPAFWRDWLTRHSALYRAIAYPADDEWIDVFQPGPHENYVRNLRQMLAECARRGTRVALVMPPFSPRKIQVKWMDPLRQIRMSRTFFIDVVRRYREALAGVAAEAGVPLIDHRLSGSRRTAQPRLFIDFIHPSGRGNAMIASDVARRLRDRALFAERAPRSGESATR